MNIFWLDNDLEKCARAHCDKHVVKMCLEYAQLLSTTVRILNPESCNDNFPYKATHKNHPCAVWARNSFGNYSKLYNLALELGKEYTRRYGKFHKSIELVKLLPTDIMFVTWAETEPPQCMPDQYKGSDLVKAYRDYYIGEKSEFAKWAHSPQPDWWPNEKAN